MCICFRNLLFFSSRGLINSGLVSLTKPGLNPEVEVATLTKSFLLFLKIPGYQPFIRVLIILFVLLTSLSDQYYFRCLIILGHFGFSTSFIFIGVNCMQNFLSSLSSLCLITQYDHIKLPVHALPTNSYDF